MNNFVLSMKTWIERTNNASIVRADLPLIDYNSSQTTISMPRYTTMILCSMVGLIAFCTDSLEA